MIVPEQASKDQDFTAIDGGYQHRAINEGHAIQRFWHRAKLLAIRELLPPEPSDVILDLGCGSGVVSSYLAADGARVTGIDSNPRAIEFAAHTYGRDNLEFIEAQIDAPLPIEERVDKIYCLEVLEHVYRHQAARMLQISHRALAPNGWIFLATPNYRSLWPAIEWAMDRSGRFPVMAGHQHVEHYHGSKLATLCLESGFRVERLTTVCLLSPWLSPLSTRLAERTLGVELRLPLRLGPILVAIIRKTEAH